MAQPVENLVRDLRFWFPWRPWAAHRTRAVELLIRALGYPQDPKGVEVLIAALRSPEA